MKKRAVYTVFTSVAALIIATLAYGNQTSTNSSIKQLVNRQVPVITQSNITSSSSFKRALVAAKAPGGIAVAPSCGTPLRYTLTPSGSSLHDVLEAIIAADPQYRWEVEGGVVNLVPHGGVPAFLNIRIAKFEVETAGGVNEVLVQLLATPEVRKGVDGLSASSRLLRGGLGYFEIGKESEEGNVQKLSINLKNVTVYEALNAIAKAHGNAIWSYTEHRCGSDAFSLDFSIP